MRVLICTGIFPPEAGGPATYSRILATELKKRGHEVRVITYSDKESGKEFLVTGIPRGKFKLLHYWRYFRAVRRYGQWADVLYAQGPVSEGYPTYLANRFLNKPMLVKVVGDRSWEAATYEHLTKQSIDDFQQLQSYPRKIQKMRDIQTLVCQASDKVIVPSEYLKKVVMGWGVKESKVRVIYNAVEVPDLKLTREQAREKLGISDESFFVVSSGRDVPWKGFETLTAVVQTLSSSTELNGAKIQLKILHTAPRNEFHEYVRAADVYVLNSGYEGLSNTLVEVLALGTPIVTTKVCGNPEVIRHEENGLLIEYNNAAQLKAAVLRLYSDRELRDKLRNNSQSSLTRFTLENMISKTLEVLKSCAS